MGDTVSVAWFDTHAHLDDEQFDRNRDAIVSDAVSAGVNSILAVGTTAKSSETVVSLASHYLPIFAAVGIQPNYCAEALTGDWDRIVELAGSPRVVAIGETGLDRYWDHAPFHLQQDFFDRHLRLSQERDLPFIVHMRDCQSDILEMLYEAAGRGPLCGVMHSFTGDREMAEKCLDMGLYISFAGMVTFKKSDSLRAVATVIPDDRILIETDSPYLAPEPVRGKRPNQPANLVHTGQCLAQERGIELETFANQTTRNAQRLFQKVVDIP